MKRQKRKELEFFSLQVHSSIKAMLGEHSSLLEEEEMTKSTIPGDMTWEIRCDLGMSPHVTIFLLCVKQSGRGKKPMQVLSVGTCWGWRALDLVSALWTDILPRSSLLLQSLADTLCPAQFVKEGMRKCKESELFMLHSKSSTGNEICPPFLLTGFLNSVWRTVTSWSQEDPSYAALCTSFTSFLSSLLSITANI